MEFTVHAHIEGLGAPLTFELDGGEGRPEQEADLDQAMTFLTDLKLSGAVYDVHGVAWKLTDDTRIVALSVSYAQ